MALEQDSDYFVSSEIHKLGLKHGQLEYRAFGVSLYRVLHFSLQIWPMVNFGKYSWKIYLNDLNDLSFDSQGFQTRFKPHSGIWVKMIVGLGLVFSRNDLV